MSETIERLAGDLYGEGWERVGRAMRQPYYVLARRVVESGRWVEAVQQEADHA